MRGFEIRRLGDANRDGWEDLVEVGEVLTPPTTRNPVVRITSSRDGSIVSTAPLLPPY
jgi:hypothetical protein